MESKGEGVQINNQGFVVLALNLHSLLSITLHCLDQFSITSVSEYLQTFICSCKHVSIYTHVDLVLLG
jgi:hypothetical protein